MSDAKPLTPISRIDNYCRQNHTEESRRMTPRQRRRVRHKILRREALQNRAKENANVEHA
jgi:hypothetical protein